MRERNTLDLGAAEVDAYTNHDSPACAIGHGATVI
jgi:hypothetical protein